MKCYKPNTDQEVEFTVLANGVPCAEYVLPATARRDPNVLECFIPVVAGDQLTLSGSFTGSVLHGAFDLLADGSFLGDKRIEGPKNGDNKYHSKRKLDIKTVFDIPKPEGHTSVFAPDKVVEGNLHVKTLRDSYGGSPLDVDAKKIGVGSLAVVCSVNQRTEENYVQKYPSTTCGDWATGGQDGVADGGVSPTHELEVKVIDEDVSKTRQQKHKRHFIQTRFGPKPWATLIFHYRSKEAIEEAGCEQIIFAESQALEPGDELTFIRASTETMKKGAAAGSKSKKTATREEDDDITVASRTSRSDALFTTPPPSESSKASPSFGQSRRTPMPTPAPEAPEKPAAQLLSTPSAETSKPSPSLKKRKLFGQTLNLHSSPATPPSPYDGQDTRLGDLRVEQEEGEGLEHITSLTVFNKTLEKPSATGLAHSGPNDSTLPIMSEDELADAIEDVQDSLVGGLQHTAPVAVMTSQHGSVIGDQTSEETNGVNEGQTKERPVHIKEEEPASLSPSPSTQSFRDTESASSSLGVALSGPRTTAPTTSLDQLDGTMTSPPQSPPPQRLRKTEKHQPCKLTPEQILPHIPSTGISITDLGLKFDEELLPANSTSHAKFIHLVREVADNKKSRYYPKSASQGGTRSSSQLTASLQSTEGAVEQQVADAKSTKIERESETSSYRDNTPLPTQPQQLHTPLSSVSKKRSASSMAASRESTPSNKKPRFDALSLKKAELLKSIEAKKQRKLDEKKALEEARKLREEAEKLREEAEMREIEMLEKMAADEDEEIEDLVRAKQEEEAETEEAKLAVERAEGALNANEES